jgi:hypothetical protein
MESQSPSNRVLFSKWDLTPFWPSSHSCFVWDLMTDHSRLSLGFCGSKGLGELRIYMHIKRVRNGAKLTGSPLVSSCKNALTYSLLFRFSNDCAFRQQMWHGFKLMLGKVVFVTSACVGESAWNVNTKLRRRTSHLRLALWAGKPSVARILQEKGYTH